MAYIQAMNRRGMLAVLLGAPIAAKLQPSAPVFAKDAFSSVMAPLEFPQFPRLYIITDKGIYFSETDGTWVQEVKYTPLPTIKPEFACKVRG